ncbi:trypsin alpha-3-like [Melitaea cinxia]|uniref:trypsin alpha-3-like n=1 Tax=Melitaea cinxia TaxID=113334 RepID=UPI001E26F651|nr:trypsin alpha-3-like [Melitaea cinxia]
MKLFIVVLGLALAVTAEETIFADYHLEVGIPERARIDAAEAAVDFDGSRIIGGQVTALGAIPHLAGLRITLTTGQTSVCGSSLISNTRLVTAAQCWRSRSYQARTFTVILGSVNYNSGGIRISTNDVVTHPNYNTNNINNDVAVIRISSVTFNNNIRPIALATGSNDYVGATAVAAGFGRTSDFGGISSLARHVSLQVIDNNTCASAYIAGYVVDSTLCTSNSGGRSPCGGDAGGPLAIGNTLIGISSFGSSRGCTTAPGCFARVTSFASWLSAQ